MIQEFFRQMLATKLWVQIWMLWMALCFILSIFFVNKQVGARLSLFTIILTVPAIALVFYLTGSVHLLGINHWLLWFPLGLYLFFVEMRTESFCDKRCPNNLYGYWVWALTLTIFICLGFDLYDFIQIARGIK